MATLEMDPQLFDPDDGADVQARPWYCYLGLRVRLQQGELMDFRAATSIFGDV